MLSSSNPPVMSTTGPPHFVDLHVNPGESVSIQMLDGNETILRGPATITMVSQHTFPPVPMPVQVPPGHMVQQIVDENGTLRHIILSSMSALNGQGNGPSPPSAPVTMIQQTAGGGPALPATTSAAAVPSSNQQPPAPVSGSSQPFPFPCCCSCCFCTSAGPGGGLSPAASLTGAPAGASPAGVSPVVHSALLGFPSPPALGHLTSVNPSARRRPPSRTSYSYFKRQNNNQNNAALSNNNMHSTSLTNNSNSTASQGHGFSFPSSPFHPNPLVSPAKPHKATAKSANLPTVAGIHMDMAKMIIPGSGLLAQQQVHQKQHVHHQQQQFHPQLVSHHQYQAAEECRKPAGHTSGELSSGNSVASVVSELLTKAAAGKSYQQHGFGMSNGAHPQQTTLSTSRNQTAASSPVSHPSSTPLSLNCKAFRPSVRSGSSGKLACKSAAASPHQSPVKSSPAAAYVDTNHSCLSSGPMNTSSSSVVSSSSVSPNSLDSSYASDKFSEVSSDRSDFSKSTDSANEMMGLIQNGIIFSSRKSSSSCSSSPQIDSKSFDQQPSRHASSSLSEKSVVDECNRLSAAVSRNQSCLPVSQKCQPDSSSTEVLSATDTSEASGYSCYESRNLVNPAEPIECPHLKSSSCSIKGSDDLLETGSNECLNRKNNCLNTSASSISSLSVDQKSNAEISSQPVRSSKKSLLSASSVPAKSMSSPSSPVILKHDQTSSNSGRSRGTALPAPASPSSDSRKSRVRQPDQHASPARPAELVPLQLSVSHHPVAENSSNRHEKLSSSSGASTSTQNHLSKIAVSDESDSDSVLGTRKSRPSVAAKEKTSDDCKRLAPNGWITTELKSELGTNGAQTKGTFYSDGDDVPRLPTSSGDTGKSHHLQDTSSSLSSCAPRESRSSSAVERDASDPNAKEQVTPSIVRSSSLPATDSLSNDEDRDGGDVEELSDGGESPDAARNQNHCKWTKGSPKHLSLSLPQLQLLNLTYTALTATSVKLKWNLQSAGTEPHPVLIHLQEKAAASPFANHHYIAEMLLNSSSKSVSPASIPSSSSASPSDSPPLALKESGEASTAIRTDPTRTVYQGVQSTCRVLHLSCAQQYSFRVRTVVDQHSLVSNLLTITTPEQALNTKQKQRAKPQSSPAAQSNHQVQQEPHKSGEKHHMANHVSGSSATESANESEEKDDQKRAVLILLLFTGFALLVAVIIQHLLCS